MSGTVFPTGIVDAAPDRNSRVLGDTGTVNCDFSIAQILALITLQDMFDKLMGANSVVEEVASNVTSYQILPTDKNKLKRFLCAANCDVLLPSGMPVGFTVEWTQSGAGILTFKTVAGAGQNLAGADGARSGGLHAGGVLKVIAANIWHISGFTQV